MDQLKTLHDEYTENYENTHFTQHRIFNYSIIIATRPDPTVLPPSRFSVGEIGMILCDFQGFFGAFFFDMHLVSDVLGIFVIMVLSRSELRLLRFQCVFKCVSHSKKRI